MHFRYAETGNANACFEPATCFHAQMFEQSLEILLDFVQSPYLRLRPFKEQGITVRNQNVRR